MTRPSREDPTMYAPVLIVDDDPRIRQTIRWALEDEGIPVAEAADTHQAVEVGILVQPRLVLLDYGLPDGDGNMVAEMLRAQLDAPPAVLLITADGRASDKATRMGAFAYLSKPFEIDDLVHLVWQGINSSGDA